MTGQLLSATGKVVVNWKQGVLVGNTRHPCIGVATAPCLIMISLEHVSFDTAFYASGCHFAEHTLELQPQTEVHPSQTHGAREMCLCMYSSTADRTVPPSSPVARQWLWGRCCVGLWQETALNLQRTRVYILNVSGRVSELREVRFAFLSLENVL